MEVIFLGILLHFIGGFASGSFYIPYKKVRGWAWESYWLVYAVFGLIVTPWLLAWFTSPNFLSVGAAAPRKEIAYCLLCGAI